MKALRAGGGPERLRIVLEGESLLNDASSITLFTIFIEFVIEAAEGRPSHKSAGGIIGTIIKKMLWLAVGALLCALRVPHIAACAGFRAVLLCCGWGVKEDRAGEGGEWQRLVVLGPMTTAACGFAG